MLPPTGSSLIIIGAKWGEGKHFSFLDFEIFETDEIFEL
jgi:hypothetical protein